MRYGFSELILFFFAYSFIGWVCETIYCSIPAKRFVNRGFLKGPYCPVYGVGAFVILLVTQRFTHNPALVFVASFVGATAVEYVTGWLLETLFHIRWWDYSNKRFQIGGRVCLQNSLLFGALGLLLCYVISPALTSAVELLPDLAQRMIANLIVFVFVIDLITTLYHLSGLADKLQGVHKLVGELTAWEREHDWFEATDITGSLVRLRDLCLAREGDETAADVLRKIDAIENAFTRNPRLLRAFPNMRAPEMTDALEILDEKRAARYDRERRRQKGAVTGHLRRFFTWLRELPRRWWSVMKEDVTYSNLFWVFLIGGVIGYIVETIFCLIVFRRLESRQGLLYGPFNQIYGLGAILMLLTLKPLAARSDRWLFFGGMLVGGAFEYFCSFLQEQMFGSTSWDYSGETLSIGSGRTSLVLMVGWGILGFVFIKAIYPWLHRMIGRIPTRSQRPLTIALTVVMVANIVLSASAVVRWGLRQRGEDATTAYARFLDIHYPDAYMQDVYPSMTHK